MVAVQVLGNDAALGFAASQGNFELNVFKPLLANLFLQSAGCSATPVPVSRSAAARHRARSTDQLPATSSNA